MNYLPAVLSFAACGISASLAVSSPRSPRYAQRILFVLGMLTLSVTQGIQGLILLSTSPGQALPLLRVFLASAIILPAFTVPFFSLFARKTEPQRIRRAMPAMITLAALLAAAAALIPAHLFVREIHFTEAGHFWGFTVSGAGSMLAVFFLLVNVAVLYYIENTYKSSTVPARVALKYPLLGVVVSSIINFIVMSRILSISRLERHFMAIETCGLTILAVSFAFAASRYPIFEIESAAKAERRSVLTITVSGLYLISIAVISYISSVSGLSFDRFGLYVITTFTAFLLLAIAFSGRARRRLRRFFNENFYLERYNYRKEWRRYARLMASSSTIDDFLSNTVSSLCETVMVKKGLIWVDAHGGKGATYGLLEGEWDKDTVKSASAGQGSETVKFLDARDGKRRSRSAPEDESSNGGAARWIKALTFLSHGGERRGFIALGPKDTGAPYNEEDRDFLSTISDQASLTLENLIMEERLLESSRMESFNRFASFVIHDLKNTLGMLSLTAENAPENLSNEEFQKDTIVTIKRSVEKMRKLIASLNAHKSPGKIRRSTFDAARLVGQAVAETSRIAEAKGVTLDSETSGLRQAWADPAAVMRILENLIINAIEATPGGGTVSVSAKGSADGGFSVTVADSGPGFDPAFFENSLFKPFRSTKSNGLGIGLVLSKSLAEAHGGTLSIDSGESGSSVSIFIPGGPGGTEGADKI